MVSATTPEAIELYGLLVLKGDLKLLKHGIGRKGYPEMKNHGFGQAHRTRGIGNQIEVREPCVEIQSSLRRTHD